VRGKSGIPYQDCQRRGCVLKKRGRRQIKSRTAHKYRGHGKREKENIQLARCHTGKESRSHFRKGKKEKTGAV